MEWWQKNNNNNVCIEQVEHTRRLMSSHVKPEGARYVCEWEGKISEKKIIIKRGEERYIAESIMRASVKGVMIDGAQVSTAC